MRACAIATVWLQYIMGSSSQVPASFNQASFAVFLQYSIYVLGLYAWTLFLLLRTPAQLLLRGRLNRWPLVSVPAIKSNGGAGENDQQSVMRQRH